MIKQNLCAINKKINAINSNNKIRIIAVSKTRDTAQIKIALKAGQIDFAENYLQESLIKIQQLQDYNLVWHFIGPIQANKTNKIAQNFAWVHSVDRLKIATRLSAQRPSSMAKLKILLQVNIENEPTKSGFDIKDIDINIAQIQQLENIELKGFMCMPNFANAESSFTKMQNIAKQYPQLDILSMGTSQDFHLAIKHGANFIRIGTDIFGKRS